MGRQSPASASIKRHPFLSHSLLRVLESIKRAEPAKEEIMDESVLTSLRGKILKKPPKQKWMLMTSEQMAEGEEEGVQGYKYTCEPGDVDWTPMNINLHMQSIKVKVNPPIPENVKRHAGSSLEDTLLLLDIVKENNMKQQKQKKEELIRHLAMKQKMQKQEEGPLKLSWNTKTGSYGL